jgi:hypothetical protein
VAKAANGAQDRFNRCHWHDWGRGISRGIDFVAQGRQALG